MIHIRRFKVFPARHARPLVFCLCAVLLLSMGVETADAQTQKQREEAANKIAATAERARKKEARKNCNEYLAEGNAEELKALLERDPWLLEWVDKAGTPLLNKAAMTDCIECVRILLDAGLPLDSVDLVGRRPVHSAAGFSTLEMLQLLVEHGADLNNRNSRGRTPLSYARTNYYNSRYEQRTKMMVYIMKNGGRE